MSNYIDELLQSRGLTECPTPLWRLKIKDEEYVELKKRLVEAANDTKNSFFSCCKDCALFYAQFWRREYSSGAHSKQMVYDALGATTSRDFSDALYSAAKVGARALRIELYKGDRSDYLNSLLYQGGLPMNLISKEGTNTNWDRFMRGLVNKKINFDELNLGSVATQSTSMREFCNQLIEAVERDQYKLMPFYCQNENDSWFVYLKDLAKQERIRHIQLHPFSLGWEFRVNTIDHKISAKYILTGAQRLPALFLSENGLAQYPSFSVQVRVNGKAIDTYDYIGGFSRYNVCSKHQYKAGDEVTLYIHNSDTAHISDALDINAPYLLYLGKDGQFLLGNQLGKAQSLLLIPDGWEIEDAENFHIEEYTWDDIALKGILLPTDHTGSIIVKSDDGAVVFNEDADMHWTELASSPIDIPSIVEPVFNASNCNYVVCSESGERQKNFKSYDVRYRSKHQREWQSVAPYGEIFARVSSSNGLFINPVKFINVGSGLIVSPISADKNTCSIKVSWSHGHVYTNEGTRKNNDVWEINKADCADPRRIKFHFVPTDNPENQFFLSVKAPFRDFTIIGPDGNNIETDTFIPYTDIDKYQYHIVGLNIRSFIFANVYRQIKWIGEKLYIIEGDQKLRSIPYEGSLLTLFDSRENLRELLGKTSKGILDASIQATFVTENNQTFNIEIKESPYRAKQTEDGHVIIEGKDSQPIDYRGTLKLFKMDEPSIEPILMTYDETEGYKLPSEILSWGKTLLTGRTRGRILPAMVDISTDVTAEYRKTSRVEAKQKIAEELAQSSIGDAFWKRVIGWFECSQREDIPASSILDLCGIAANSNALLFLAFQLYCKCSNDDERAILASQLDTFASDLAFQWFWVSPSLQGLFKNLYSFIGGIDNPEIQSIYIQWALGKENKLELLGAMSDASMYMNNIGMCLNDVLTSFTDWMKDICIASATDTYEANRSLNSKEIAKLYLNAPKHLIQYSEESLSHIEISQGYIDEEVNAFFDNYKEPGQTGNDMWMYKRINAVIAHMNGTINLLAQPARIKRSIIFCSKSCNEQYMIALNNKLCKR